MAAVLSTDVVKRFSVTAPQPPGHDWQRRLTLLVFGFAACVGLLLTSHSGGRTTTAAQRGTSSSVAPPPSTAAPTTTTTVDAKAISAGVASLVTHEGPSPQELAAAPPGGGRHGKHGGSRIRK